MTLFSYYLFLRARVSGPCGFSVRGGLGGAAPHLSGGAWGGLPPTWNVLEIDRLGNRGAVTLRGVVS